ncbi:hypothetical protein JAAARDRAFT_60969 [Jaapia argillacea MUCL 33604]|uniref:BAR domain-containing protein n=1 Tax=Jaapia argillacea MUCL 33604 TaxID=933084 RepID=A0A067PG25_9AGAM|nr:hypothetical protein JAAARDRAFT_60969 [Jaapia argillacea MUCL 33604]
MKQNSDLLWDVIAAQQLILQSFETLRDGYASMASALVHWDEGAGGSEASGDRLPTHPLGTLLDSLATSFGSFAETIEPVRYHVEFILFMEKLLENLTGNRDSLLAERDDALRRGKDAHETTKKLNLANMKISAEAARLPDLRRTALKHWMGAHLDGFAELSKQMTRSAESGRLVMAGYFEDRTHLSGDAQEAGRNSSYTIFSPSSGDPSNASVGPMSPSQHSVRSKPRYPRWATTVAKKLRTIRPSLDHIEFPHDSGSPSPSSLHAKRHEPAPQDGVTAPRFRTRSTDTPTPMHRTQPVEAANLHLPPQPGSQRPLTDAVHDDTPYMIPDTLSTRIGLALPNAPPLSDSPTAPNDRHSSRESSGRHQALLFQTMVASLYDRSLPPSQPAPSNEPQFGVSPPGPPQSTHPAGFQSPVILASDTDGEHVAPQDASDMDLQRPAMRPSSGTSAESYLNDRISNAFGGYRPLHDSLDRSSHSSAITTITYLQLEFDDLPLRASVRHSASGGSRFAYAV